jgi:hypothetical protein
VLADEQSRFVKASLPHDHEPIHTPLLQQFFDAPAKGSSERAARGGGADFTGQADIGRTVVTVCAVRAHAVGGADPGKRRGDSCQSSL